MYAGGDSDILITQTKEDMNGVVKSTDGNWTMNYEFTDQGYTGKCNIKVKTERALPYYMKVFLMHRNGTELNEFGKTYGSNGYKG